MEQRRTIIYTLTFEMKVQFYGDIENKEIIRRADARLFESKAGLSGDSDIYLERVSVTPNPITTFGSADSYFGFLEEIVMANDSA